MSPVTHEVSLRVEVSGPEQFSEVYQTFSLVAVGLGLRYPGVSLGSISLPAGYEEDEETLARVRSALRESGMENTEIDNAVYSMKSFGIIFREKKT